MSSADLLFSRNLLLKWLLWYALVCPCEAAQSQFLLRVCSLSFVCKFANENVTETLRRTDAVCVDHHILSLSLLGVHMNINRIQCWTYQRLNDE